MHFAIYGRKSVYSDKSDSVDNQQQMCKDYIKFHFKDYVKSLEVYSDEGYTGGNMNRPGLKRLLEDIKDGAVNALIVYQLDRISRSVKDFSNIYALLEEKNVMFISVKENIDTATPIGKAMMYVTMVFAQMERENISARITDNLLGLAKKGFWVGGNPPYGYIREHVKINGKTHVSITVDTEAAKYDEWIFDTFLENNYSLSNMETAFKNQGIRTVNGAFFSSMQLYNILSMPYCVEAVPEVYDYFEKLGCQMGSPREKWDGTHGVMVYGRSTEKNKKHTSQPPNKWLVCIGYHKPFIPAAKWLAVQERFKQNIFNKTMKYDMPLLKGVLRCAKCGCLMAVSRKKTNSGVTSHYYCTKRMRQGVNVCNAKWTKCDIIDGKAMEIFQRIEADPGVIQKYTANGQKKIIDYTQKIKDLEIKEVHLRTKIERLTESITEAENSAAVKYIIAQIEKEDLNLAAIKRIIEETKTEAKKQQSEKKSTEKSAQEIAGLIHGLDGLSPSEKNKIVREVVKECIWDGNTLFLAL